MLRAGCGATRARKRSQTAPGHFLGLGRIFIVAALLLTGPARAQTAPEEAAPGCAALSPSPSGTLPATGLVIALPEAECAEAPLPPPRPAGPDIFGSVALAVASTPLDARWHAAHAEAPLGSGPWTPVLQAASSRDRSAQIHIVNAWVNSHLAFAEDAGRDDWAPLERAFARGHGDCEDFAIAKLQLLQSLGVPRDDLYLVIVRDEPRSADHAVLAVRDGAMLVVLDSRTDRVLRAEQISDYRPIMSYSSSFAWTHGYRGMGQKIVTGAGVRR